MKMILFASALALGTAAIAQDATPAPTTPPADQSAPASAPMSPAPDASAPATPPPSDPNAGATTSTPDATATPAPAPSSDQGSMSTAQQSASSTDDSNLPTCSKSVTDKCKQGGGKGGKHAMHHKKK